MKECVYVRVCVRLEKRWKEENGNGKTKTTMKTHLELEQWRFSLFEHRTNNRKRNETVKDTNTWPDINNQKKKKIILWNRKPEINNGDFFSSCSSRTRIVQKQNRRRHHQKKKKQLRRLQVKICNGWWWRNTRINKEKEGSNWKWRHI